MGNQQKRPAHIGAWFTHEDHERVAIKVSAKADLAVLIQDFYTVPVDDIDKTKLTLTLMNGKVMHQEKLQ